MRSLLTLDEELRLKAFEHHDVRLVANGVPEIAQFEAAPDDSRDFCGDAKTPTAILACAVQPGARVRGPGPQGLQAAGQEERHRLARDLHDSVKQQLFAIRTEAATAQAIVQALRCSLVSLEELE